MQESQTLPMEMSALLELAVNDTAAAAADPGVSLNMLVWYRKDGPGKCVVCMAGAVLRQRNLLPPSVYEATPASAASYNKSELLAIQLHAIDDMRLGLFINAATRLGINTVKGSETRKALDELGDMIMDNVIPEWEWDYKPGGERDVLDVYRAAVVKLKALGL